MTLDVHPEEVQEKSHKMMDMLTAAAPARLARFIHDAVLEPTRSSDRHQFLCLQLRKSGEEVLRFEHRYNHHSWAPLEVAVANEKGRQDTGINLKKIEDKKLDLSGKKLYSTGGLQLCIANQHPLLWHYNFIMWDTLSEFKDKLPDKVKKEFQALIKASWSLERLCRRVCMWQIVPFAALLLSR